MCLAVPKSDSDSGFTLIEVMAALSVFAIAAIGLIHVSTENTEGVRAIENRMLASIIADNEMTLTLVDRTELEDGVVVGQTEMVGRNWKWRKTISTSPNPLMQEIKIEAWEEEDDNEKESSVDIMVFAFKGKMP